MHLVRCNFQMFTSLLQPPDYKYWLRNVTLRLIEGSFRWYLENHNVEYQSGFLVFARYWRVFWCEEMDRVFPYDLRRKMTNLVRTALTNEYDLDLGAKTQPSVNIDDLLFTTYHLMAVSNVNFPTVRCRHQLSTLRKMMISTFARPGTLVESSGYMRSNDALKWKDIELYMVKHPEDPACQALLMRVTHRPNKGKRNKDQSSHTQNGTTILASVLSKTYWYSPFLMMPSPASALKNREIFGSLPMSQAIDSTPPYTLKRALKTFQYSDVPSGILRVTGLLMRHKPFHMIERKNTRLPPARRPDIRISVLCINTEKEQQPT